MNKKVPPDFAELYDDCFSKVYNYVRYRIADPVAADDVVSRVFEQALAHLGRFDPSLGPAEAWLIGIARNAVLDHFRADVRRRGLPLEVVQNTGTDRGAPAGGDDRQELLQALEKLEDRDREILGLKFGARMTNRDIASHLGLTESNVGVIVYRAIKKLQEKLQP